MTPKAINLTNNHSSRKCPGKYLDFVAVNIGVVEPHGGDDGAVVGELQHAGPGDVVGCNFSSQTIRTFQDFVGEKSLPSVRFFVFLRLDAIPGTPSEVFHLYIQFSLFLLSMLSQYYVTRFTSPAPLPKYCMTSWAVVSLETPSTTSVLLISSTSLGSVLPGSGGKGGNPV